MWGHWYPLFQTSDYSAHEFQSQGGSVIACALLSLVCNNPQSHLWLPGLGIEPGLLAPEASMIPLHQPNLAKLETYVRAAVKNLGSGHPWSASFQTWSMSLKSNDISAVFRHICYEKIVTWFFVLIIGDTK